MKELVVNGIMNNITKYYDYDNTKISEIKYGIESLYLTITKTIIIFIISFILNITKELMLLFVFYSLIRLTGFGVHAKKSWHCWVTSLITFVLIPLLIKYVTLNKEFIIISYTIFTLLLLEYAPADTEKRPLINKKRRIIYKVLTILLVISYLIYSLIQKDKITIINTLYFSILLETLLVLPCTYKLFGVKYNNYKNYKKKGGNL